MGSFSNTVKQTNGKPNQQKKPTGIITQEGKEGTFILLTSPHRHHHHGGHIQGQEETSPDRNKFHSPEQDELVKKPASSPSLVQRSRFGFSPPRLRPPGYQQTRSGPRLGPRGQQACQLGRLMAWSHGSLPGPGAWVKSLGSWWAAGHWTGQEPGAQVLPGASVRRG